MQQEMQKEWTEFRKGQKYLVDGIEYWFEYCSFGVYEDGQTVFLFCFSCPDGVAFLQASELAEYRIEEV